MNKIHITQNVLKMRKIFTILCLTFLIVGMVNAQSIEVPPNLDGTDQFPFTYLNDFIDADTSDTGEQLHDTYLLQRGSLYFFTGQATWTFDVHLKATGDESLGRPVVSRANKTGGTDLAPMYRGFGNFSWDGIYVILGEEGADAAQYETAPFRPEGDDKTFSYNDCIIEKSRQGAIRCEGENAKIILTNNIIRNFGDYERFQGNGRIVDIRDNFGDTVIIHNNVMHNILDRLFIGFRQKGLNYFEFSQNTVFNHVGRHGFIQMKNTKETVIKDNLFMNPSMIGTAPSLANEQINHLGVTNYLFSIDTLIEGSSVEMSNNNLFWNDDVLEYYNTFDSVTQPLVLSPEFEGALADPSAAYFTEVLELNSVPSRTPVITYCREAMTYQDSVGITDIMVEDVAFAGTAFDKGYLFDFSTFDPCYDDMAISATAASDGGAVGVRFLCDYMTSNTSEKAFNSFLDFSASPNPAADFTKFKFSLPESGHVELDIFDYQGRKIQKVFSGNLSAGQQEISWNTISGLAKGMYFANLQTESGRMYTQIIIQ